MASQEPPFLYAPACPPSTVHAPEPDGPLTAPSQRGAPVVSSLANVGRRRTTIGISQYDPAVKGRPAWNAGRQVGGKRALKPRQIWAIRFFLDREGRMRDCALFDLAIDSKLRGCDLVKIKIGTLVSVGKYVPAQWWRSLSLSLSL